MAMVLVIQTIKAIFRCQLEKVDTEEPIGTFKQEKIIQMCFLEEKSGDQTKENSKTKENYD